MILLRPQDILAALECVSTDETRPMLNGVLVGADGSLTATDGHRLIHIPACKANGDEFPVLPGFEPLALEKSIIIPSSPLKTAAKAPPKRTTLSILRYVALMKSSATGKPCLVATDLDTTQNFAFRELEGPFPNYLQVVPKPEIEGSAITGLGDSNLEAVLKVSKILTGRGSGGYPRPIAIMVPKDPVKAHTVYIEDSDSKAYMIIMPLRLAEQHAEKMVAFYETHLNPDGSAKKERERLEAEAAARTEHRARVKAAINANQSARLASNFTEYIPAEARAAMRWETIGLPLAEGVIVAPVTWEPLIKDDEPHIQIVEITDTQEIIDDIAGRAPVAPVVPQSTGSFGPPASLVALVRGQQAAITVTS